MKCKLVSQTGPKFKNQHCLHQNCKLSKKSKVVGFMDESFQIDSYRTFLDFFSETGFVHLPNYFGEKK
jgi:hypothetical protein